MTHLLREILAYVGFDEGDAARLRELHPVLASHFPAIAEEFSEAVGSNAGAASVLSGPAQLERLRGSLIAWMGSGLLGPHDVAFYERRSQIGARHVDLGLPQHYMITAMNVVRTAYVSRIAVLFPPPRSYAYIGSVNKLLDIELAMMLRPYQVASEAKLVNLEGRQVGDQLIAMQTLSSGLAHEIRNPLNSAKLQLELLERRLRRQVEDRRLIEPTELAHHEIKRLSELVNDFLAFAQPPSLQLADHDLVVVAHHVVELEQPFATKRGIALALRTDSASIHARVDATKLHHVIQNLVHNAIEAASMGGHVELSIAEDCDRVHVNVDDDGPGIPERVRARMYEPFFSTKESSTGLGMSIVHRFVTMHAGTVAVVSTPAGTHFDIALPRGL